MSRAKERARQKRKIEQQKQQATIWPELCRRIDSGDVIPIISNNVFFEQIFDVDGDGRIGVSSDEEETPNGWSIEEQLADIWAEEVGYPLSGREKLARVALYNRVVKNKDDRAAKVNYLNWLKDLLLFLAEEDPSLDPNLIEEQKEKLEQSTFREIAEELGYPRPIAGQEDTLARLAALNLPIYITTSHFDFLERAILANGRQPCTQVCFWTSEPLTYSNPTHRTNYDFVPTPETPLVYHLFGLEHYPESLILTEDDHLDFLVRISQDTNQAKPLLPPYLRQALTQSSLLLLGYQPRDWDFRVVFRGLINATPSSLRMFNIAIQVNPENQPWVVAAEDIKRYLSGYFEEKEKQLNFTVQYDTTAGFLHKLWEAWDQWRQ